MTRTTTRRRYLTAGVTAAFAALAGCSDLIQEYEEEDEAPSEEDANESSNETDADEETVDNVDHENPEGSLEFVQPEDGDEVSSPVSIELAVEGLELEAVSEDESPEDGVGHLHVIVDEACLEPGYVIPQEDGYHHLSDGETETELDLEPGEYNLCAQAGDDQHNAYDMTDEITIEVTEGGEENGDGNETESEDGNETENSSDD